jgi:hypothetical protein
MGGGGNTTVDPNDVFKIGGTTYNLTDYAKDPKW